MLKKVVVIGPECTGKTTLCQQLAKRYNTLWCPEYAREYLLSHGNKYSYNDLLTIAKGQIKLEDEYINLVMERQPAPVPHSLPDNHPTLLFVDTDMYVMKVWCEFVFNKCHSFILKEIEKRKYDLYLLCNTDLPWVADELREYPQLETRKELYGIYEKIMQQQGTPWVEIRGDSEERQQRATTAVDGIVKSKK
jgi:NadR type nicotinamide-nucleotide adenylyltransferase